jgi:membrane-bound lytic murein transglycosylase F
MFYLIINAYRCGRLRFWLTALLSIALSITLSGCSRPTIVEKIKQEKVLHVITRNAPTVYYEDKDGPAGLEYDLAKMFADKLGVELRMRVAANLTEVTTVVKKGYAHIGAAGLAATPQNAKHFRFSPPYLNVTQQIVYRMGSKRPKGVEDLIGKTIWTVSGGHHVDTLEKLSNEHQGLEWVETDDMEVSDLLGLIQDEKIDYAIVDSNELEMYQAIYPNARVAFDITSSEPHVWIFPEGKDESLTKLVAEFFQEIEENGTLLQLKERYYGHLDQLNYVGARTFIQHIENRLPKYKNAFEQAADKNEVDWRLLAAIGYQESHWRANATSPTGVRGLMMLTQGTAKDMGIKNRLDPVSSIRGGAKYFAQVHKRIPKSITEPDRTWFALASYNVGYGHVEDARILAQKDGKNPNAWMDVKEYLPLLAKKKWYSQTKYGYARGYEPVAYVQNIRRYYDVLTWMSQPENKEAIVAKKSSEIEDLTPSEVILETQAFETMPPML